MTKDNQILAKMRNDAAGQSDPFWLGRMWARYQAGIITGPEVLKGEYQ